jgi:hypothetical protein
MTCTTGKQCYPSPQAAHKAMRATVGRGRQRPWNNGKPGIYQCQFCKAWHTTNSARPERAA